jgi:hypothetical protein
MSVLLSLNATLTSGHDGSAAKSEEHQGVSQRTKDGMCIGEIILFHGTMLHD